MAASIESLAMAGVDYNDICIQMSFEESKLTTPPPHLLADGDEELDIENRKLRRRSFGKVEKDVGGYGDCCCLIISRERHPQN